jgi:Trk-type K+ transport system membrane component
MFIDINWITIWLCFFFGLGFTILFRFLNGNTKKADQRENAGLPLSGWIAFLGFNLISRLVVQSYFFVTGNYFLKSDWIHLDDLGGARLHTLLIFEMFLSLFSLTGTGALLFWFFGRRDIFPRMFIWYGVFYLIAFLVQILINQNMVFPQVMMGIRRMNAIHYFRIAYVAILVLYMWKSDQVKQTFVYPPN